jgi:hypothetical protein
MFMKIVNIMITGMSYAVLVLGVLTMFYLLLMWVWKLEKSLLDKLFLQRAFIKFVAKRTVDKFTNKKHIKDVMEDDNNDI